MILEEGRVCIVKTGRDFGKIAMIVGKPEGNYITIEGPKLKKRKINIFHVWPLKDVVKSVKDLDKIKL